MLPAVASGLALGLSLIVAIGAQNLFVLRQGIRREHTLAVALVCAVSDALLIAIGVSGLGAVLHAVPWLIDAVRWAGAVFLAVYALLAARRALRPSGDVLGAGDESIEAGGSVAAPPTRGRLLPALLTCLALTWLNPHVYLDTMVLMGSIGNAQGDPGRWWFAVGGAIASVGWFAALGYGSRYLTRFFASPRSWQILDICVAVIMVVLAIRIAFG